MVVHEKLLTADDLWEISHHEPGKRFELVQGVLIEVSPVGGLHGIIALKIGSLLLAHVEHNRLGVVTVETGYAHRDGAHRRGCSAAWPWRHAQRRRSAAWLHRQRERHIPAVDRLTHPQEQTDQWLTSSTWANGRRLPPSRWHA